MDIDARRAAGVPPCRLRVPDALRDALERRPRVAHMDRAWTATNAARDHFQQRFSCVELGLLPEPPAAVSPWEVRHMYTLFWDDRTGDDGRPRYTMRGVHHVKRAPEPIIVVYDYFTQERQCW